MFSRVSIVIGLVVALCAAALTGEARARQGGGVTTSLSFHFTPANWGSGDGDLRATFRASPAAGGMWKVDASFRPRGLKFLARDYDGFPVGWYPVNGTGSAQVTVAPGVPVHIGALGMHASTKDASYNVVVSCTFTVAADGTVTVQSIGL